MLTKLRDKASIAIEPLVRLLAKLGLTPNSLTIASFLVMVAGFSTLIITGDKVLFLPALITSFILDSLDGSLARYTGKVTKFGGVLDSTVDRANDFLSIISLKIIGLPELLVYAAILTSFLTSYIRARVEVEGVRMEGVGLIERGERAIYLAVIYLVTFISCEASIIALALFTLLTLITVLQRLVHTYGSLRS